MRGGALALAVVSVGSACAAGQDDPAEDFAWRTTASLETWLYANRTDVRADSLLNPGNRVAALPSDSVVLDGRVNLRAEKGPLEFIVNPRLLEQTSHTSGSSATQRSGRLTQALVRFKDADNALTVGRELFTWGPANLRSPSNPFYFDAGRNNPLAATPGVDLVRYTLGLGSFRLTSAYVFSTNQLQPAQDLGHTLLVKLDQQGSSHLISLIASQQKSGSPFVGGFAQFTPNDAWLLYGEFGSWRQPVNLLPNLPGGPGPFFTVQQPAPRSHTALLGANYTLESGQALIAEYLHNPGGYTGAQADAYFQQAAAAGVSARSNPALGYAALGQALGLAPRLLRRDYLWLNWQSNPQESGMLWRVGWTQSMGDHSGQALVYLEKNFIPKLSGFVAITANKGDSRTEYGALLRGALTVGVKWFAF